MWENEKLESRGESGLVVTHTELSLIATRQLYLGKIRGFSQSIGDNRRGDPKTVVIFWRAGPTK